MNFDNSNFKKYLKDNYLDKVHRRIRIVLTIINTNPEIIQTCINSILKQKYDNWICYVNDDTNSFTYNNERFVENRTNFDYSDTDICIDITNEDFFMGEYVFDTIVDIFNDDETFVVYNNYLDNYNVVNNGSLSDNCTPLFISGYLYNYFREFRIYELNHDLIKRLDKYILRTNDILLTKSIRNRVFNNNKGDLIEIPDRIILYGQGGLGDHLSLSNLPYEYHKRGYQVYLLGITNARNSEIVDFVWNSNPYITESVDYLLPNDVLIGHIRHPQLNSEEFIKNIEEENGICSNNTLPNIYYTPYIIKKLQGKTVLNLDCITANYDSEHINNTVELIIETLGINRNDIFNMKFDKNTNTNNLYDRAELKSFGEHSNYVDYETIICSDLKEHCDIINSCKYYITLMSGGASLAAAIDKDKTRTYVIVNHNEHRISAINKSFMYSNQNYIW
jgi:hypothetical protein